VAAEYGININVRTKDEQLKKLQNRLTAADKAVASLQKKLDLLDKKKGKGGTFFSPSQESIVKTRQLAKATKLAKEQFEQYTRGVLNFEGANRKGITSTKALAMRMKEAGAAAGITTDRFRLFTQGFTKLNFSGQIKSLQRFNESAKITASTFSSMSAGNVPGIAGFSNTNLGTLLNFTPAKTVNAIERYLDTLSMVRKDLDFTEKDFKDVTARIKEMNGELKKQRDLLREPQADKGNRRRERRLRIEERDRLRETLGGRIKRFRRGDQRVRNQVGSSALIGGSFPLLFGQGGGAALGGAIGGAGGGLLGGQFGFALSLVGTQIGSLIDTTIGKVGELGQAFGKFNQDTTKIVETLGESNTIIGRNIELLEKARGKQAAFDEALRQTTILLGDDTTKNLKQFGEDTTEISSNLAKIGMEFLGVLADINQRLRITKTLALFVPGAEGRRLQNVVSNNGFSQLNFSPVGKRTGMKPEDIANFLSLFEQVRGNLGAELSLARLFGVDDVQDVKEDAKDLLKLSNSMMSASLAMEILNKEEEKNIKLNKTRGFLNRQRIRNTELLNEKLKQFKELTGEDATEAQIEAFRKIIVQTTALADSLTAVNNEIEVLDKKLIELNSPGMQLVELSRTIGTSFEESFKGIIKGTMSVGDAFRNMLNRVADHFLDTAAKMAASQLQRGILGLFSNMFKITSDSIPSIGSDNVGDVLKNSFDLPKDKFANGGRPPVGRASLVGERGPELFVPDRSGTIIPNNQLGGMGGSTSIVVNVDASGSSVEGDEQGGRELGLVLSAAIESELIKQKRPGGLLA